MTCNHRRPVNSRSLSGWAGSHQHWYSAREQFYAIYYTTEFKFIGRGDAFIAPTDGTYTFKLWGSPGGTNPYTSDEPFCNVQYNKGGLGGFVMVDVFLKRNQKIYAFVGSAGTGLTGSTAQGGYNGGGATLTCGAGPHSATGGGATHISWSYNPITADTIAHSGSQFLGIGFYLTYNHNWDNIHDVISVAGGGGGGGAYWYNGHHNNESGQLLSYGGGTVAGPGTCYYALAGARGLTPCANNNTGTGYAHGAGQWGSQSSAGGAGWYGGYSQNYYYPNMAYSPFGGNCCDNGGGGTSYIRTDYTGIIVSGNDPLLLQDSAYMKPVTEGINGYIKVMKR